MTEPTPQEQAENEIRWLGEVRVQDISNPEWLNQRLRLTAELIDELSKTTSILGQIVSASNIKIEVTKEGFRWYNIPVMERNEEIRELKAALDAAKESEDRALANMHDVMRERDEAQRECEEQARLLGAGSEREARLIAQLSEARDALARLRYVFGVSGGSGHE